MAVSAWWIPVQLDLAQARQNRLTDLATQKAFRAKRIWLARLGNDFDVAWASARDDVVGLASSGQVAAAAGASTYLASTARADGVTAPSAGPVQPAAFGGVDKSGRDLEGLLYGAVTTAKTVIGAGGGLQSAFAASGTFLAVMVRTAILDAGRSADLTAMTARSYTHYVRVVSPGACSRCAILAGTQSAQRPFKRHPGCRCTAAPENEPDELQGRFSSPTDYFESLPSAEQERVFTKAGAEAIRAGADPITVVTARRGAPGIEYGQSNATRPNSGRRMVKSIIGRDRNGQPILGYTTGESTSIRGAFGKQNLTAGLQRLDGARYRSTKRVRLMPETIVELTDDVTMRQVLLRDAGYINYPVQAAELRAPLGGTYIARRAELIREDRRLADEFYRRLGVNLG